MSRKSSRIVLASGVVLTAAALTATGLSASASASPAPAAAKAAAPVVNTAAPAHKGHGKKGKSQPVTIYLTRHGQTIGFYIPIPKRPGQSERDALVGAGRRMQEELARLGLTEEELTAEFKRWRKSRSAK